jgi:succinoglycan biosynthesis protein ExoM
MRDGRETSIALRRVVHQEAAADRPDPSGDAGASAPRADAVARTDVDVCICTYHRPQIVETLKGIAAQDLDGTVSLHVIVADNAAQPDAQELCCAVAATLGLELTYVHAPVENISIARNSCLAAARAEWIAFVDDDECPSPHWLRELLAEAERGSWDAVLGPVQAVYPEDTPDWLRAGDFHSTRPVWVRGRIETGYTGNVLLRGALIRRYALAFRTELGRTGGEDLDFFYRLRDAGGRIGFAPAALVYEPVMHERTSLAYLLRRSFRRGQSHGARLRRSTRRPMQKMLKLQIALAKALVLGLAAAIQPKTVARNRFLTRALLQCGVVARLAGWSEIEIYGRDAGAAR